MLLLPSLPAVVSRSRERAANVHMIMLIFLYYLFSFVFIADSRIWRVGDTLWVCRRSSLERRQRRHGFRSGLKPPQFCLCLFLQHLCTKRRENVLLI